MKITKGRLKRIIREEYAKLKRKGLIGEHVGDEHHEHPHEHREVMVPRVNNKDEAEDLLHDTFLAVEEHLSLEEIEAIIAMLY